MNDRTINADETLGGSEGTLLAKRYRVIRQLGQGGMGSVWLAADTQLDNREVAIKMLPSILVSNKRAYNQLKSEALVSLKLTHPNIAAVRAFEENGGNPFLVVDYIDGQTLDDYLADKGKLSEDETIRLLGPIASALDYAHGEGVVHRDVKPGNVMIRKDGHPFILDFGIAREIQETMTRVTGKLSSGTLMYMSPEQLHGDVPTIAQDVYSFAVMAYECLTGWPPFTRGAIEDQIRHRNPTPLSLHFIMERCIMAGLAKSPEDRPANCSGVLRESHTVVPDYDRENRDDSFRSFDSAVDPKDTSDGSCGQESVMHQILAGSDRDVSGVAWLSSIADCSATCGEKFRITEEKNRPHTYSVWLARGAVIVAIVLTVATILRFSGSQRSIDYEIVPCATVDTPPRPCSNIRTDYPEEARIRGEQGDVTLELDISTDGTVGNVRVLKSPGFTRLEDAAINAVRCTRFIPAQSSGRAIPSTVRLTLNFKLK